MTNLLRSRNLHEWLSQPSTVKKQNADVHVKVSCVCRSKILPLNLYNVVYQQLRDYMNGIIKNKIQCLKQTGWDATKWTNKCHWMRWRKRAHLLPSLTDGWNDVSQNRHLEDNPEVTHLACLSGLSNSEGQRWEQNKKEGTVLSQAGRARHVREPSVRQKHRPRLFRFCDSVLMTASNELRLHENQIFRNIQRWQIRWEVRASSKWTCSSI